MRQIPRLIFAAWFVAAGARADLDDLFQRVELLTANGASELALRVLDGSLGKSPSQPATLALAASIALQAGQIERAAGYATRLASIAPDAPATLRVEGDLAMAQKRYGDAIRHYDAAARSGSDSLLAGARYRARLAAGAPRPEAPLEEWLARVPGDAAVRVLLAEHEQRTGNAPQTLSDVQRDWLARLRKERGLQAAVRLAGPFIMRPEVYTMPEFVM